MIKQQYVMQFTTRTDYYQNFEISFDEFWEIYCKENDFDEEESDLSQWDNEDLMDIAWDEILKNPDKYRSGEGDYDNEEIMKKARFERDSILKEARDLKKTIISESKDEAKIEAEKIIQSANEAIRNEKNAAVSEIKKQVAGLSIEIAEKLLNEKLSDNEKQMKIVDELLKDVKLK